jgi:hypothetical protein
LNAARSRAEIARISASTDIGLCGFKVMTVKEDEKAPKPPSPLCALPHRKDSHMSATLDWSWVFVMDSSLYSQLRNFIFSNIVPTSIYNIPCDGNTINQLMFSPAQSKVVVETTEVDALTLTSPIQGSITYSNGTQESFKGTVTLTVFLDYLFIAPCPSTATFADADGATWTNCLNLTPAAFSAPTVALTQGSSTAQSTLTSCFQDEINDYVASSPNSLGTQSSPNLPQYFAPTYQKFITLTSDPTDVRVLLLVMVNNDPPPTGDQHSAFESSQLLEIPDGSDSVIAFDDYTLYEYVALQMEASPNGSVFTSINVSQDPAVLTAKFDANNYSGTLQSQINDDEIQTSIGLSNTNNASFAYATTVTLINNSDGTQSIEIKNDLTKSSVTVNMDNPVVISIMAALGTLAYLSPLGGIILLTVVSVIEYYIVQAFLKAAQAAEFDKTKDLGGNAEFQAITLDGGVVLYATFPKLPTDTLKSAAQIVHAPLPQPDNLNEGIGYLLRGIESLHDTLSRDG